MFFAQRDSEEGLQHVLAEAPLNNERFKMGLDPGNGTVYADMYSMSDTLSMCAGL